MKFEIHALNTDVTSGSIPISWCLDKEMLDYVKTAFTNPYVVIVIAPVTDRVHDPNSELRFIAPLVDAMTYVSFKRPGKTKVFAFIMDGPLNTVKKRVFERDFITDDSLPGGFGNYYALQVVGGDHEYHKQFDFEIKVAELKSPAIELDVPQESFAKEPSKWEKDWVLWLIDDKGVDECAFRRRKIFAYTIQPLLFLLNVFIRLVLVFFALMHGSRGTTLKIRPLTISLSELHYKLFKDGTIFVKRDASFKPLREIETNKELVKHLITQRQVWRLLFYPYFVTFVTVITAFKQWPFIGFMFTIIVGSIVAVALIATKAYEGFINFIIDKLISLGTTIGMFGRGTTEQQEEQLICTGDARAPKKKTIRLRYLALKSKVCKPYASNR